MVNVKCPYCNAEIEELSSNATATTTATINHEGKISIDEDFGKDYQTDEWKCLECDEVIAWTIDEATDFLNGKNLEKSGDEKK